MARTPEGSKAYSAPLSVIETCRLRGINPWPYISEVIALDWRGGGGVNGYVTWMALTAKRIFFDKKACKSRELTPIRACPPRGGAISNWRPTERKSEGNSPPFTQKIRMSFIFVRQRRIEFSPFLQGREKDQKILLILSKNKKESGKQANFYFRCLTLLSFLRQKPYPLSDPTGDKCQCHRSAQ